MNATGSALVYSTFLGGRGGPDPDVDNEYGDVGDAITVDKSGNAYVTGYTYSTDFPVTGNAWQAENRAVDRYGDNVFISKINSSGSSLLYSTYLGGTAFDIGEWIALDPANNAYVTGEALSTDFPVTSGAFQTSNKSSEYQGFAENGFVSKLDPTTGQLVYSTYLGGSVYDGATSIAVDSSGDAYVTGYAASADFPVTKETAYQSKLGGSENAFATELNPDGTALIYSTFLGGAGNDDGVGIALDPANNFYLTGNATSTNFPTTPGAYLRTSANGNPFVSKFNQGSIAATTTTLASSPNPSLYEQSVTFTAAVTAASSPDPTGTVNFYHGATLLGSGKLSGGVATFATSTLPVATLSVTAEYEGSATEAASTSTVLKQTVLYPTTTALTSTPNPSTVGESVTFTATVTAQDGGPMPSGTVDFYHSTTLLGTGTLADGVATFTTSSLPVATLSIHAVYLGHSDEAGSTSAVVEQAVDYPTTTTLTSSPNPSVVGQAVTFTATVAAQDGGPVPSGTVDFYHSTTLLGSGTLAGGVATFTTSTLAEATLSIHAVYPGHSDDAGSTSAVVKQVVNK